MRNFFVIRIGLLMALLLLSACASKSTVQFRNDLWLGWEESDMLMQGDYPDAIPVLLVHGWNGDESTWPDAKRLLLLEQKLGRDIYYFNYRTGAMPNRYPPLEAMEEHLERYLKSFPTGVDVVAHSMGGLLVRQYLSHHAGNQIRRLLLLSVPHYGANGASALAEVTAVSAVGNVQVQEIQPGSDFLWQLNSQEGSELEGVEVLNAYTTSESSFNSDMVVDPLSAWLPWAANISLEGDHHALASKLDRYPFMADFLQTGQIPTTLATKPEQRDLWVRIKSKTATPLKFSKTSVKRRSAPSKEWGYVGLEICCDQRSSMYDKGGVTVIATDIKKGEQLQFLDRSLARTKATIITVPSKLTLPITLLDQN
ncbi:MAG: alpha/beta fold hydrolase [Mariprofundus sp.]|nr:alpha/beta fold hydrolase [Mariprofundus sp.]